MTKSVHTCYREVKSTLSRCRGFSLGFRDEWQEDENYYVFTASCYPDSLEHVIALAKHYGYIITPYGSGLTFYIAIRHTLIVHPTKHWPKRFIDFLKRLWNIRK